jgi:hypothetical protein
MGHQTTWDAKEEETLRQLWPSASASVIARALHRTRSAICGKIARMKLHRRAMAVSRSPRKKPAEPKPARKRATIKLAPINLTSTKPVPFLKAKSFHCRAVLDERGEDGLALFCGARKVSGSPWCARHHRLFLTDRRT